MDFTKNDFLGSFADENVEFNVKVVRTTTLGDNFWKVMIFLENTRYIKGNDADLFYSVPGSDTVKAAAVNASTFADYLQSAGNALGVWLSDLFGNGFSGDCILVACGQDIDTSSLPTLLDTVATVADLPDDTTGTSIVSDSLYGVTADEDHGGRATYYKAAVDGTTVTWTYQGALATVDNFKIDMTDAYELMKAYAYHKTTLAGETDGVVDPQIAVTLAGLCGKTGDYKLLSSAPYFPYTTTTPGNPGSDPLFAALIAATVPAGNDTLDAFMCASQYAGHNGSLVSLGLALSYINGSGTCVGNSIDMSATSSFIPSGADGTDLPRTVKATLTRNNIQYYKYVGDGTNVNVAAYGAKTIKGDVMQAIWIVAYVSFMTKCNVAILMTHSRNFKRDALAYSRIIETMRGQISKFGDAGAGRLTNILITAPAYKDLPPSDGDTIEVPNAWSAWYVDQVRNVKIYGTLYIGG